ncbi:MAG: arsenate reductase ArsC [Planctomycetota bacterium]|jgi:arsenate reductase|nr:arsenate reductase ArsC [Planctomycetota bacterium]MDP6940705.1 arsenate reductase ArsC [Planctomycetota bacterium]
MKILFLCTQNACRSQMAEHWARHLAQGSGLEWNFASAGTKPATPNPKMLQVMTEAGVDVSNAVSTHLEEFLGEDWDFVFTLCDSAAESCPIFPGAGEKAHHPFPDPAHGKGTPDEILNNFRDVRDSIRDWIGSLLNTQAQA